MLQRFDIQAWVNPAPLHHDGVRYFNSVGGELSSELFSVWWLLVDWAGEEDMETGFVHYH